MVGIPTLSNLIYEGEEVGGWMSSSCMDRKVEGEQAVRMSYCKLGARWESKWDG